MEWIFTCQSLEESPSRRDGISQEMEKTYRRKSTLFIDNFGGVLKCERVSISTAQAFFHRFYALQSFKKHNRFIIAAACLFLAAKSEECPRKLHEIINMYCTLRPKVSESEHHDMPITILRAERILLQTLCFDLYVEHPFKAVRELWAELRIVFPESSRKLFSSTAVTFIAYSYRTTLCLEQRATVIAACVLFLSALQLDVKPVPTPKSPVERTWFEVLDPFIDPSVLQSLCLEIVDAVEFSSHDTPPDDIAKKLQPALLKSRLETYNAINNNIIFHPSPTTVAVMPPQILNTKEHSNISSNISNAHLQMRKEGTSHLSDYPYLETEEQIRQRQIKASASKPTTQPPQSQSTSYTIQHPPPIPSVRASPAYSDTATPPPPPPDTPSSATPTSFYPSSSSRRVMPDTPDAPPPPPPDTPESCQSTPAPPPPPTPSPYDHFESDQQGYESAAGTPAPPPPPTPDYHPGSTPHSGYGPGSTPQTQSAKNINNATPNVPRRPFHQLAVENDFPQSCQYSPKKRRIE